MTGVTESESVVDDRHLLPSAAAEACVRAALPQAEDCVVVAARLDGRVRADVLLTLRPQADPDADYEPAVRAAFGADGSDRAPADLRRVFVVGVHRDYPATVRGDRGALARRHFAELLGARLPGLGPGTDMVLPEPAERIRVEFAGDDEGVAELTWGQREIWQSMTVQGNWLPLGGWKPLDPGTTVEDVAGELAYLHSRFPSMRTRLRFDERARPMQVLSRAGTTELAVYDVDHTDAADPDPDPDDAAARADELAAALDAYYQHSAYDLRTEWPVRMAVIRRAGAATHMVVVMHHLALDGGGAENMFRDVAVRATAPPSGFQQLAQTEWQRSEAGRRHSGRAMRHFEALLRAMPAPTFPPSSDPRRPRYWSAEFESPALRTALAALVDRTGVDQARAVMAVYAIALARVTGVNPVLMRPVIGNRFRRQLADVVCHTSQAPLVLLDVAEATVEEVMDRAAPASMNALKHSYFDPEQLVALVEGVGRERGVELDIASFVNDRRTPPGPSSAPETSPEPPAPRTAGELADDLAAARAASTFRWVGERNDPVERMFLHIDDVPGALRLSLEADTRALDPAHIELLARTIEEVAVAAAVKPGLDTGVAR